MHVLPWWFCTQRLRISENLLNVFSRSGSVRWRPFQSKRPQCGLIVVLKKGKGTRVDLKWAQCDAISSFEPTLNVVYCSQWLTCHLESVCTMAWLRSLVQFQALGHSEWSLHVLLGQLLYVRLHTGGFPVDAWFSLMASWLISCFVSVWAVSQTSSSNSSPFFMVLWRP